MIRQYWHKQICGYAVGVFGVAAVALLLGPFYPEVRSLTAANAILIVVLFVALQWGMKPALVPSVLGALYLNYYFVPPLQTIDLHDFHLGRREDTVGLIIFMITAIAVGRLSSRAEGRAAENKRLYDQLRASFEQASQLEGVRRSEQMKSALLDTVTHDLRTPLTAIQAATTTIIDIRQSAAALSPASHESEDHLLGIIVGQSHRLNHFIETMIELATIDVGGREGSAQSILVEDAIDVAVARAADPLREHKVEVRCGGDLKAAGNVKAVAQVLFSLMENAAKYAPSGSRIRVTAESDAKGDVQLAVEDEGPGIPVGLRDRIFDRFFRGNSAEESDLSVSGLGLGLAIARGIVEGQGGRIWVEGRKDGAPGSRFVFTLQGEGKSESAPVQRAGEKAVHGGGHAVEAAGS